MAKSRSKPLPETGGFGFAHLLPPVCGHLCRLGGGIEQGAGERHAGDTVERRMVDLQVQADLATGQAFDDRQLPQGVSAIERRRVQAADTGLEIREAGRCRQDDAAQMTGKIRHATVNPHRVGKLQRHRRQPGAKERRQRQPRHQLSPDLAGEVRIPVAVGRRLDQVQRGHVHRRRRRFEVQKHTVQPTHVLHSPTPAAAAGLRLLAVPRRDCSGPGQIREGSAVSPPARALVRREPDTMPRPSPVPPAAMTRHSNPASAADDKNRPLIEDIRLLGRILGEVIREQDGPDAYELVERVRQLSIAYRLKSDNEAGQALDELLRSLSNDQTVSVIRAFSYFSHLANIAEDRQHVRRRRLHERAGHLQEGSLALSLRRLTAASVSPEQIGRSLRSAHISPVLTAHPTEVQRQSILAAERTIAELVECRETLLGARELADNEALIKARVTQIWQTRMSGWRR
jgi:hypothetical protein